MIIGMISGATRVIGKSQGYLGLPLRDVLIDCTVNGENTPAMETAWLATPDEIARIGAGAPVILQILGSEHPPVSVDVGEVPEGVVIDDPGDVQAEMKRLRARNAEIEALVYVPGVWCCAKCKLVLVSSTLRADTGQVKANTEPQQCPNGCGPLWRKTERQAGNELCDQLDAAAEKIKALEARVMQAEENA